MNSPNSQLTVRSHTGDFDDFTRMSPLKSSPASNFQLSPSSKKKSPVFKRSQTAGIGGVVSPPKKATKKKNRTSIPEIREYQAKAAIEKGNRAIERFERKLVPKRNLLGNAAAIKLDKARRIQRNRELINFQLEEKRKELKVEHTEEAEEMDNESVVVESEFIKSDFSFPPFSELTTFDKTNTSRETVASPLYSSRYRRKIGYGTQLFFDEFKNDEKKSNQKEKSAVLGSKFSEVDGSGSSRGSLSSRSGSSSGSSSSGSDSEDDTTVGSTVVIKRSASLQFVDDMFGAGMMGAQQASSTIDEMGEEDEDESYDGNPKEENYFGEKARNNFFALYNKMSRESQALGEDGADEDKKKSRPRSPQSPGERRSTSLANSPSPSRPQSSSRARRAGVEVNQLRIQTATKLGMVPAVATAGPNDFDDDFDIFDLDAIDEPETSKSAPQFSPRHRFLQLLIKEKKVAPLPIIIRRSPEDDELNLAHRSLGDDYIIYLSDVVKDLPNLSKVNLRDNRLTDRGMGKFIHTLASQQQILSVDLSENKIDSKSAEALTHFLKRPDCTLATLKMSNADLDDDEVAIFMDALEANRSITEMDVSGNKLGGIGEKSMKLKGNKLVGGASIAAALTRNETLHILNLSWNKLGYATALHLGSALSQNSTLLELNLAYNTIKDEGAECIGAALMSNAALTSLNISHNGIGSLGAFVIATGLRLGRHMRKLNMSGNPIGCQGSMSLLQTLNYHSVEREILLHECSFEETSGHAGHGSTKVNMVYPSGRFTLDLSKPRFRCMLIEFYRLASVRRGYSFKNIEYRPLGKGGKSGKSKVSIRLSWADNPAYWRGQPYGPWKDSTPRKRHHFTTMGADEWMKIEYELFLRDESTGQKWDVPADGTLSFDFQYVPRCACPIDCLNATGLKRFIKLLTSHPKECLKILKTTRNVILESYQVDDVMNALDDGIKVKDKTQILSYLLLCIRDTSNTNKLFPRHLRILNSLKDIHQSLRSMYYIATNAFSGHYCLDLDNPLERLAGIRLMEIGAEEQAYIKHAMPTWNTQTHGYTAQRQNRSNFRNEKFQRMNVDKGCTDDFFRMGLEDKSRGVLEFDFVSISRPVDGVEPMSSQHLEFMMNCRGIKNAVKVATQTMKMERRRAMQLSIVSGNSTQTNPLCVDASVVPPSTHLITHPSLPSLDQNEEIMYSPPSRPPKQIPEYDPSSILGHFVVDLAYRLDPPTFPPTAEDLDVYFRDQEFEFSGDMRPEDLAIVAKDMTKDTALYIGKSSLERYTVNLCIRIMNTSSDCIFELISMIRKSDSSGYEVFGHGKADSSEKPTSTSTIVDILGLSGENAKYEIGILANSRIASLNPTHKKYIINDDIYIQGSDIYCKLKCKDWTQESISEKTKEVCARVFACHGVADHLVRIVNHRTADAKTSEFFTHKFCPGVSNHIVIQQVDVCISGIPQDTHVLLKSYLNSGKGASPDDASAVINTLWRWRARTSKDRGHPKIDLLTYPYEFWGFKFLQLRSMISSFWISCQQAASIVSEFPLYGYDAQPHRESAIVCVFSRLVDLENIEILMDTIPQTSHSGVYQRLGWLNAINAWDVDKLFSINLEYDDARIVAIMLAKFAAVEPGDNFIGQRFRRSMGDLFIPGWDLPASWTIDPDKAKAWDGVPRKGEVIAVYSSSLEDGCKLIPHIRKFFFEKYTLLAVPRGNGDDFYQMNTDPADWQS